MSQINEVSGDILPMFIKFIWSKTWCTVYDLNTAHKILAQMKVKILGRISLDTSLVWNMLPSQIANFQIPTFQLVSEPLETKNYLKMIFLPYLTHLLQVNLQ